MNLKHIFIAFVLIVIIGAGILIWKVKHIPDELVVVNVEPIPRDGTDRGDHGDRTSGR